MITIHHLGTSQSDRIVWLMEELGQPYELKWYERGDDMLAPEEYRNLHPIGTSPIVSDGDRVMNESAAIVEYISHKYGDGKLSITPEHENYPDYLFWMHANNNMQAIFFLRMALGGFDNADNPMVTTAKRREDAYYHFLNDTLAERDYVAGEHLTCADIMLMFNLTALPLFGGRTIEDLPNVKSYVDRISQRPAYQKAMAVAGPGANRPDH